MEVRAWCIVNVTVSVMFKVVRETAEMFQAVEGYCVCDDNIVVPDPHTAVKVT